jgi:hypothetical protein
VTFGVLKHTDAVIIMRARTCAAIDSAASRGRPQVGDTNPQQE